MSDLYNTLEFGAGATIIIDDELLQPSTERDALRLVFEADEGSVVQQPFLSVGGTPFRGTPFLYGNRLQHIPVGQFSRVGINRFVGGVLARQTMFINPMAEYQRTLPNAAHRPLLEVHRPTVADEYYRASVVGALHHDRSIRMLGVFGHESGSVRTQHTNYLLALTTQQQLALNECDGSEHYSFKAEVGDISRAVTGYYRDGESYVPMTHRDVGVQMHCPPEPQALGTCVICYSECFGTAVLACACACKSFDWNAMSGDVMHPSCFIECRTRCKNGCPICRSQMRPKLVYAQTRVNRLNLFSPMRQPVAKDVLRVLFQRRRNAVRQLVTHDVDGHHAVTLGGDSTQVFPNVSVGPQMVDEGSFELPRTLHLGAPGCISYLPLWLWSNTVTSTYGAINKFEALTRRNVSCDRVSFAGEEVVLSQMVMDMTRAFTYHHGRGRTRSRRELFDIAMTLEVQLIMCYAGYIKRLDYDSIASGVAPRDQRQYSGACHKAPDGADWMQAWTSFNAFTTYIVQDSFRQGYSDIHGVEYLFRSRYSNMAGFRNILIQPMWLAAELANDGADSTYGVEDLKALKVGMSQTVSQAVLDAFTATFEDLPAQERARAWSSVTFPVSKKHRNVMAQAMQRRPWLKSPAQMASQTYAAATYPPRVMTPRMSEAISSWITKYGEIWSRNYSLGEIRDVLTSYVAVANGVADQRDFSTMGNVVLADGQPSPHLAPIGGADVFSALMDMFLAECKTLDFVTPTAAYRGAAADGYFACIQRLHEIADGKEGVDHFGSPMVTMRYLRLIQQWTKDAIRGTDIPGGVALMRLCTYSMAEARDDFVARNVAVGQGGKRPVGENFGVWVMTPSAKGRYAYLDALGRMVSQFRLAYDRTECACLATGQECRCTLGPSRLLVGDTFTARLRSEREVISRRWRDGTHPLSPQSFWRIPLAKSWSDVNGVYVCRPTTNRGVEGSDDVN